MHGRAARSRLESVLRHRPKCRVRFLSRLFLSAAPCVVALSAEFTAKDRQPTPAELATLPAVASPEKAAALLREVHVADGFQASIFATPPAVNYPVFVAAATDGTVYVSSDGNGSLDRKPHLGRVLRVRDTNHDGQADEVKAFVPDIDSPRGLVWDHDRLYLLHPPDISVFFDRDGDGVAEERKTLVRGIGWTFKDRPADHGSNGLELGVDGWLYAAIGDFGFMEAVGTDGRKLQLRGGGVVRVRPDGSGLELWADGTRNILEVAVSPLLDGFARDNTNDGGGWDVRFHHFSGFTQHGYPRLFKNFPEDIIQPLADYGGGSGCGAAWIDEPGFPAAWNNAPFTADWGRERVYHHGLKTNGATFSVTQEEFLRLPRVVNVQNIQSTASDGTVTELTPLTTDGINTMVNISGSGPTVLQNGLNGLPVLDFTPSNSLTSNHEITHNNFTLITVSRQTGQNGRVFTGPGNKLYGYWNGQKKVAYLEGWVGPGPDGVTSKPSDNKWDIMITSMDNYESSISRNGERTIESKQGAGATFAGLSINNAPGGCCNGETSSCQVAEILLWDRELKTDELVTVEEYLMKKYGFTDVDLNHPYLQKLEDSMKEIDADVVSVEEDVDAVRSMLNEVNADVAQAQIILNKATAEASIAEAAAAIAEEAMRIVSEKVDLILNPKSKSGKKGSKKGSKMSPDSNSSSEMKPKSGKKGSKKGSKMNSETTDASNMKPKSKKGGKKSPSTKNEANSASESEKSTKKTASKKSASKKSASKKSASKNTESKKTASKKDSSKKAKKVQKFTNTGSHKNIDWFEMKIIKSIETFLN